MTKVVLFTSYSERISNEEYAYVARRPSKVAPVLASYGVDGNRRFQSFKKDNYENLFGYFTTITTKQIYGYETGEMCRL